jgi:hypothetical protein
MGKTVPLNELDDVVVLTAVSDGVVAHDNTLLACSHDSPFRCKLCVTQLQLSKALLGAFWAPIVGVRLKARGQALAPISV